MLEVPLLLMIQSFIEQFPEEVFYSIIARYYKQTLAFSPKSFSRQLFNSPLGAATIDLPSHLECFHLNTKQIFPYSTDDIIENFTLYPFYLPFLRFEKRSSIINAMKGDVGNTVHTRIGINASKIVTYRYPRYCPACIEENTAEDPYWERLPQTDLIICPKHNCFIHSYVPDLAELNRSLFISAPKGLALHNPPVFNEDQKLYDLAVIYQKILNKEYDFDINLINYHEKVREGGYAKEKNLDVQKLINDFNRFHSQEFLYQLFPRANQYDRLQWLPDIIKRPLHIFHPLRHILTHEFVKSIEAAPKAIQSFGRGPWPCLNKASDHFHKNVIHNIEYHIDPKSKRQIGVLSCICGMVYTKSILTKNGSSIEFVRIKEWGPLWIKRLRNEIKTEKSFRTIASILGTDAKTISKLSKQFNNTVDKNTDNRETRTAYRKRWVKLLNKFSNRKVFNARLAEPKIYAWLYRNDNSWLLTINKLHSQNSLQTELKLDWQQMDQDLVIKLSESFEKLRQENFRGRISRTLLAKIINHEKYLLGKNAKKLPLSISYLEKVCETREEYQIKRIKLAKKQLDAELEIPLQWKIMRKAGLRKELSPVVEMEINKIIGY